MVGGALDGLLRHFAGLEDPRVERTKLHPLQSILAIAIMAVISGAESWNEMEAWAEAKRDWLTGVLELPYGIPSHDTFNRVFAALDPTQFRAGFLSWMRAVAERLPAQVVAVDGKTVRGSHDRAQGTGPIHMVTAWATANRLVLAQVKVADKSNEITVLPQILRVLALSGCLVTIDAMGCQRTLADQIVAQGGDYVLALKENQGTLVADVGESFARAEATQFADVTHDRARTVDKAHGRLEIRRLTLITDPDELAWLQQHHHWPHLAAIGRVEAERRVGSEREADTRYYLLSQPVSAAAFGAAVRAHWGIENRVHWLLDVGFHEDQSRVRTGYAAENLVVIRHIALNLLTHTPTRRWSSVKARRLRAGWDDDYLLDVLQGLDQ
jgi:predicted transposase YbfD/YdcC